MTNDSAKPETVSDSAKPESFRSHLPAIVAATAGTVTAAVLGSLLGTAGTIVGMAIASLMAGTLSWWAERGIRQSTAMATARADAIRARARPLHADEDAVISVAATRSTGRHLHADDDAAPPDAVRAARGWPRRRWAVPVAIAVAAFIGCAVPLTLLEHAAGKPLSAIVQGEPGHGTTLGGGAVGKPAPSRAPSPSPSTTGSATAPASSTAPGNASSSPAASPTPGATGSGSASPTSSAPSSATPSTAPATPAAG
jgi:hypothetical protein